LEELNFTLTFSKLSINAIERTGMGQEWLVGLHRRAASEKKRERVRG
jgi:hypothetical protein